MKGTQQKLRAYQVEQSYFRHALFPLLSKQLCENYVGNYIEWCYIASPLKPLLRRHLSVSGIIFTREGENGVAEQCGGIDMNTLFSGNPEG